jgi:hypothetical protein
MATIDFRFSTQSGEYPGAYYCDYFRDDGYERALYQPNPEVAQRILRETYLGPDVDGIDVEWTVFE